MSDVRWAIGALGLGELAGGVEFIDGLISTPRRPVRFGPEKRT